jgi:hypothetical protein
VEFRCPDILDSDPTARVHEREAEQDLHEALERAQAGLRRTRDYGRTLWTQLDEARRYLLDEVAGGEDARHRAMLTDRSAWRAWVEVFARVSSALAGVTGDSGLGRSEATLVARAHGVEVGPMRG